MKSIAGLFAAIGIAVALSSGAGAQACTFTLSRTNIVAGPEGPIFARTTVTASAQSCQWTASTTEPWIVLGSSGMRTGDGDQSISFAANPSPMPRTGTVTVAGQTVTVTQQSTPCVTSLSPNLLEFPYPGFGPQSDRTKPLTVNAPPDCFWQHAPWPIFLGPNPTLGDAGTKTLNITLIVMPQGTNTLEVAIGSVPLTIKQLDPPCVFTLTPSSHTVSVIGGTGQVTVTGTGTDCSFTPAVQGSSGLTFANASTQTAPATLQYTVTANPGQFQRQMLISVPNASAGVTQNGAPARVEMSSFNFAGIKSGGIVSPLSPPEDIQLTIDEQPGSAWTVTVDQPWLVVTPSSGSGPAKLRVSVDAAAAAALPLTGAFTFHFANISVTAAFAPASVRTMGASVTLKAPGTSASPTGVFETPLNNTTVSGATPVTGWAVDDISVGRIHLYRDAVPGEAGTEIYIGDAIRVKGARPDIAAKGFPGSRSAGWGYMLLTNVLPGGGNGVFTLSAYVDDVEGRRTLLGRRTVTVDNTSATRPFGTIDFPAQGETVTGTIVNRGWVLAKSPKFIPFDGSTIRVYIDGAFVAPVTTYDHPRPDVKAFFDGLANSDGPEARFTLDTTLLADGVHTIAWGVLDSNNDPEGIGSRYFTVQNGLSSLVAAPVEADARSLDPVTRMPMLKTDVWSREGVDETAWATRVETDAGGKRTLHARRAGRVELFLDPTLRAACGTYTGHLLAGEVAGALPAGASLDAQHGIFRWQLSAETAGAFEFVFVQRGCDTVERRIPVRVVVESAK